MFTPSHNGQRKSVMPENFFPAGTHAEDTVLLLQTIRGEAHQYFA
jgi:hypothetical protein